MPTALLAAAVTLLVAASALAAPERNAAFYGWRYGPISGSATLTFTSPRLSCSANAESERRVVRGTYKLSFTGSSTQRGGAPDISYNTAAGGPAGNTETIGITARRRFDEVLQVRVVKEDPRGELICTVEDRPCSRSDTHRFRSVAQRLNVWMRPDGRVRINHPSPGGFGVCSRNVPAPAWDFPIRGKVFPLAPFNRRSGSFRWAFSAPVRGETDAGVRFTGTLAYRVSIGIKRIPGTPLARCKVC